MRGRRIVVITTLRVDLVFLSSITGGGVERVSLPGVLDASWRGAHCLLRVDFPLIPGVLLAYLLLGTFPLWLKM